jgi:hypothetical protein
MPALTFTPVIRNHRNSNVTVLKLLEATLYYIVTLIAFGESAILGHSTALRGSEFFLHQRIGFHFQNIRCNSPVQISLINH